MFGRPTRWRGGPRAPRVAWSERYRTSRAIFGQSLELVGRERRLWVFPAASAVLLLSLMGASAVLFWGFDAWGRLAARLPAGWEAAAPMVVFFLMLPVLYPTSVAASVLNTAYAHALHERLAGRRVSLAVAWSRGASRLGTLARFNLIALLVAGLLQVLGALLSKLRLVPYVGQAVQVAGTLGWAVAAYFVIPVVAIEREPRAMGAIRRSCGLARQQWGKSVAGLVTLSLVILVPMLVAAAALLPLLFGGVVALALFGAEDVFLALMVAGAALFVLVGVVCMVLQSAAQVAYQVALYRYATTGDVAAPFTRATLVDAWAPYRRP